MELSFLFADVRGSTPMAEGMNPVAYASLMNRFYEYATRALIDTGAFIDKFVGDEVMAVYLPVFAGPNHARAAVEGAQGLLASVGYGSRAGSWLPVGVGVHTGVCYFGTVKGAEGVFADFTALGDPVNVGARLVSAAAAGEAVVSEATIAASGLDLRSWESRTLSLKGKSEAVEVRVFHAEPTRTATVAGALGG
jgi:adenylate cyclase